MIDNDKYKLVTRRYLALGLVGAACSVACFVAVMGAIKGNDTYVTLGAVGLLEIAATVVGFYFGKKVNEE